MFGASVKNQLTANHENPTMCRTPTDAEFQSTINNFEEIINGIMKCKTKTVDSVHSDLDLKRLLIRRSGKEFPQKSELDLSSVQYATKFQKCCSRVAHNLRTYIEWFVLHGYYLKKYQNGKDNFQKEKESLTKCFMLFLALDMRDQLEDYLKFHTAYLFASVTNQTDLPMSSWTTPGTFMCGPFTRFIRNKRSLKNEKVRFSMFWSLMHFKRGMMPLKVNNVVDNCIKHAKLMTSVYETPDSIMAVVTEVSRWFGKQIEEKKMKKGFKIPAPSTRACFENSITNGGARRYIYNNYALPVTEDLGATSETMLISKQPLNTQVNTLGDDGLDFLDELQNSNEEIQDQNSERITYTYVDYDRELCEPVLVWKQIERDLTKKIWDDEVFNAAVVALPEPFKTRIITKSEACLNY